MINKYDWRVVNTRALNENKITTSENCGPYIEREVLLFTPSSQRDLEYIDCNPCKQLSWNSLSLSLSQFILASTTWKPAQVCASPDS